MVTQRQDLSARRLGDAPARAGCTLHVWQANRGWLTIGGPSSMVEPGPRSSVRLRCSCRAKPCPAGLPCARALAWGTGAMHALLCASWLLVGAAGCPGPRSLRTQMTGRPVKAAGAGASAARTRCPTKCMSQASAAGAGCLSRRSAELKASALPGRLTEARVCRERCVPAPLLTLCLPSLGRPCTPTPSAWRDRPSGMAGAADCPPRLTPAHCAMHTAAQPCTCGALTPLCDGNLDQGMAECDEQLQGQCTMRMPAGCMRRKRFCLSRLSAEKSSRAPVPA